MTAQELIELIRAETAQGGNTRERVADALEAVLAISGQPGADGVGIADVVDNADGTMTIVLTDESTYTIELPAGPQGEPGEPGQTGAAEPLKQLSSCTYEGELITTATYKYDNPTESTVEYRFEYTDVFATKIECKNNLHQTWKQTNIVWENEKISSITHQNITEWTIL